MPGFRRAASRLMREVADADLLLMCYTPITAHFVAAAMRLKVRRRRRYPYGPQPGKTRNTDCTAERYRLAVFLGRKRWERKNPVDSHDDGAAKLAG